MNETRPIRGALYRTALPAVLLFCLAAAMALPVRLHAQTPATTDATEEAVPLGSEGTDVTLQDEGAPAEECQPPSTQQWVMIGVGTLVIFVVCFFLLAMSLNADALRVGIAHLDHLSRRLAGDDRPGLSDHRLPASPVRALALLPAGPVGDPWPLYPDRRTQRMS